jgi:hypothetical protein
MASAATSSYLPTLPVPHEREGVWRELKKQQWMLRVQLGERA